MIPIYHANVRPGPFPTIDDECRFESNTPESDGYPPFVVQCIISVIQKREYITAHRNVTIRSFIQMFMIPDWKIDFERLLQVFREVGEIDIDSDTPAQQLGPLLKFVPLSPMSIAQSKPALRLNEKKVLENLMDFMVQNNWCIPWMEESTGRFVGIEQPLYSSTRGPEPLIDEEKDVRKYYFPVTVLQAVSSKLQEGTVNSTPTLLPSTKSELTSIIGHHENMSICIHVARANGSVRRSPVNTVPVFNGRWLQEWRKTHPRLQHVYVQFVTEHTDEFPLETVTFEYPLSLRATLRYLPHHSVYTCGDCRSNPGTLDHLVFAGDAMFSLQNNSDCITAFEYFRYVKPLEDALGRTRWMTICRRGSTESD